MTHHFFIKALSARRPIDIVLIGHEQLRGYRDDGRVPSQELLDDIAAYESILNAPDAEERAKEYMRARQRSALALRPREIARSKGWI